MSQSGEEKKCCRFCLDETLQEDLITPCNCEGTARYVHLSCLRRWQREVVDERARICQVCRSPFSVAPPPQETVARLHVRRSSSLFAELRTNPHYDREAHRSLPEQLRGQLLERMKPGCLVLQTPRRADVELPSRFPRTGEGVMALFEVVMLARMAHWHKGIFLLGFEAPGEASDGSDALLGVNLAGQAMPVQDDRSNDLVGLPIEGPVRVIRGGPVRPERTIGLVAYEGQPTAEAQSLLVKGILVEPDRGALFGELHDLALALRFQPQLRLQGALVFHGHAVWSSAQLLSEIARGSWGLCSARWPDLVPNLEDPQEHWSGLWAERDILSWVPDEQAASSRNSRTSRSTSPTRQPSCRSCVVS